MDFRSGELITSGSTSDTELNLTTELPNIGPEIIVSIRVISGTVKFANGEAATNNHGWTYDDGFIYTFITRDCPLHFDAAGAADTFVITVVG